MENTQPVLVHQCGQCYGTFETEDAYLAHTCPETGVTPQHPESMGPNYAAIQAAALERGAASQPERKPLDIVETEESANQDAEITAPSDEVVTDPAVASEPETPTTAEVPAEPIEVPASQEQPLTPMAPDLIIE